MHKIVRAIQDKKCDWTGGKERRGGGGVGRQILIKFLGVGVQCCFLFFGSAFQLIHISVWYP